MKVRNMSIFMGDDSRRERQNGIGQAQDNKNRKSIFAGNLTKKPDLIAQKKQVGAKTGDGDSKRRLERRPQGGRGH